MCDWSPNHGYEIYPTFDGLRRAKTHMKCDEYFKVKP